MDLEGYVNDRLIAKEVSEQISNGRPVKFSVNVDEVQNNRLKYVAKELGITRAELAYDLMIFGLGAIEEQLKINHLDFESLYSQHVFNGLDKVPLYDLGGNPVFTVTIDQFKSMVSSEHKGDQESKQDVKQEIQSEGVAENE